MSIRQDVLNLPRVKKAKLSKAREQRLGGAVEEAAERLNGMRFPKIWNSRGRPPDLDLITVTGDVMRTMAKMGLPANWWRGNNRAKSTNSLLVEIMDLIVQQARRDGAQIAAPGSGYWRRVIQSAQKLHRGRPIKLK